MSFRTLFISDLHLEAARPDITRTFLQFLERNSGRCESLYILGDLFEVWIGDDDPSPLGQTVAQALQQFSAAGSAVFLMHGNRDFLLGDDYASRCGGALVTDPHTLLTPTGAVVLLHGDTLCTDDSDYQQFRSLVRKPEWQQEFLAQSLDARRAFADRARAQSQTATANKDMGIMDVNQLAVEELIRRSGQLTILHGHTHRPAVHHFQLDAAGQGATAATRIVLGSWDQQGWYAESDADGIRLVEFPLAAA